MAQILRNRAPIAGVPKARDALHVSEVGGPVLEAMIRKEPEKHTIERCIRYLEEAIDRCRKEDFQTLELEPPLQYLEVRVKKKWPFEQFRKTLEDSGSEGWQIERRYQMLNASLNAIKLAVKKLLK